MTIAAKALDQMLHRQQQSRHQEHSTSSVATTPLLPRHHRAAASSALASDATRETKSDWQARPAPQQQPTGPPPPCNSPSATPLPTMTANNGVAHQDHHTVLILDYGSQYTQLITRRVREIGMFSVLFPGDAPMERIQGANPSAIILSGGPNSVHVEGSPRVPEGFFDWCESKKIPVLGICYGMQMITHLLGGEVKGATHGGEYGRMPMDIAPASRLFSFMDKSTVNVWMSHGDEAVVLPEGFTAVAKSHQVSGTACTLVHPVVADRNTPEAAPIPQGRACMLDNCRRRGAPWVCRAGMGTGLHEPCAPPMVRGRSWAGPPRACGACCCCCRAPSWPSRTPPAPSTASSSTPR